VENRSAGHVYPVADRKTRQDYEFKFLNFVNRQSQHRLLGAAPIICLLTICGDSGEDG
jgi:hypothetical protein